MRDFLTSFLKRITIRLEKEGNKAKIHSQEELKKSVQNTNIQKKEVEKDTFSYKESLPAPLLQKTIISKNPIRDGFCRVCELITKKDLG